MTKVLKLLGGLLGLLVCALVIYIYSNQAPIYDAPYPNISASSATEVIAHGEYLFYGPAHCAGCHAPRDQVKALEAGKMVLPSGGEDFHLPIGSIYAPNITPHEITGIGRYSDGEIARTLRYGIKPNGHAMIDFMPFYDMNDYDLTAIISFLRQIQPVDNARPLNEFNLIGKALFAFGVFKPMGDGEVPPSLEIAATAEYGEYLAATVANCMGCHTNRSRMTGEYIVEAYSGGFAFGTILEDGTPSDTHHIISPNLTPDPETGRITTWTEEGFIARFRAGKVIKESVMPWGQFKRMSDTDLRALYRFFMSLPPTKNDQLIPVGVQEGPPA